MISALLLSSLVLICGVMGTTDAIPDLNEEPAPVPDVLEDVTNLLVETADGDQQVDHKDRIPLIIEDTDASWAGVPQGGSILKIDQDDDGLTPDGNQLFGLSIIGLGFAVMCFFIVSLLSSNRS